LVLCRITSETFGPVVISLWRGEKMPSLYYFAAWTDSGCLLGCDHQHQTVMSATSCIACAGGYVVAVENGELRALEDEEEAEFQGETVVVNLHGALIATAAALTTGMRISIFVYLTDKRAAARVVYINPENPLHCGIELAEPQNIWGVPLPPDDWEEASALER